MAHLPLHLTLIIWCVLDISINAFIMANLVLCQKLIRDHSKTTLLKTTLLLRTYKVKWLFSRGHGAG